MKDDGNYPGSVTPNSNNRVVFSRKAPGPRQPILQVVRRKSLAKSQATEVPASVVPVSALDKLGRDTTYRPVPIKAQSPTKAVASVADDDRAAIAARRRQRNHERRMLLKLIMQRWPQAFPAPPVPVRPLVVGIHRVIAGELPGYSLTQISHAIALWRQPRTVLYLRAIARGGRRYDLEGNPQATITVEEQRQARATLATLEDLWRVQQKRQPSFRDARKNSGHRPLTA